MANPHTAAELAGAEEAERERRGLPLSPLTEEGLRQRAWDADMVIPATAESLKQKALAEESLALRMLAEGPPGDLLESTRPEFPQLPTRRYMEMTKHLEAPDPFDELIDERPGFPQQATNPSLSRHFPFSNRNLGSVLLAKDMLAPKDPSDKLTYEDMKWLQAPDPFDEVFDELLREGDLPSNVDDLRRNMSYTPMSGGPSVYGEYREPSDVAPEGSRPQRRPIQGFEYR